MTPAGCHRNVPAGRGNEQFRKEEHMLWTIAVVLVILWVLGLLTGYTMGNFINFLLLIAISMVLVRVRSGGSFRKEHHYVGKNSWQH